SNGAMLAAALEADGCAVRILRSGDDPAQLEGVLDEAADSADLVLTTGGIGHGAYDVVKELLGPHGRDSSRFSHLALRPGGPPGRPSASTSSSARCCRAPTPPRGRCCSRTRTAGSPAAAPAADSSSNPPAPCTAPTAAPERSCRTAGVWPLTDGRTCSCSA